MNRKTQLKTIALMVLAASAALILFMSCYLNENKYTRPRARANMSVVSPETGW